MDTAKQVGGDFYDFYFVDSSTLALVIADVSGKGVPAAMFMMQAKTIIKNLLENKLEVDKAITQANVQLCEGNDAQMFVTAWVGLVDIETGKLVYVNAGHNPPLIKHGDNDYEYLKNKSGFLLAGFEFSKYKKFEYQLQPGDKLLLYTDGVTEATNVEEKLYSENRLINFCNNHTNLDAKGLCLKIKEDIQSFTEGAEQSDDITMLSFTFFGSRNIKSIKLQATIENIDNITNFINEMLENNDCPMKIIYQIDTVVDEI